ncbi:MAG: immunoglobulin domain-containing protein [Verrucomicrobiota bacterium]
MKLNSNSFAAGILSVAIPLSPLAVAPSSKAAEAPNLVATRKTEAAPVIVRQPVGGISQQGTDVSLNIEATGNTLTYQWFKDGLVLPGATSSTLALTYLRLINSGHYACRVSNSTSTVRSRSVLLKVTEPAPVVVRQPVGGVFQQGSDVALNIEATGSALTYQWFKDGLVLPGATSPTLALSALGLTDSGHYTCKVSNSTSTVRSRSVLLKVTEAAPVIVRQPVGGVFKQGSDVALSVEATGTALTYQWFKDGLVLPGASSPTLALKQFIDASSGIYVCKVSNLSKTTSSQPARLKVLEKPAASDRVAKGTPNSPTPVPATPEAVTPKALGSLNVMAGGSGYSSAPTVVLTGGGGSGSGATAIAEINAEGQVISVKLVNPGSGYVQIPNVILVNGGGEGAVIQASFDGAPKEINLAELPGIDVISGGQGYTSAPSVMLFGGGGSGATAVASINQDGQVTGVRLISPGSGYTSLPSIFVTGGGGEGAIISVLGNTAPSGD